MFFVDAIVGWWGALPWWARYGVAVVILGLSGLALLKGRLIIWGWGLGVAFLFLAGRSDSEKRGYNF